MPCILVAASAEAWCSYVTNAHRWCVCVDGFITWISPMGPYGIINCRTSYSVHSIGRPPTKSLHSSPRILGPMSGGGGAGAGGGPGGGGGGAGAGIPP